jgi:hypothetical protein
MSSKNAFDIDELLTTEQILELVAQARTSDSHLLSSNAPMKPADEKTPQDRETHLQNARPNSRTSAQLASLRHFDARTTCRQGLQRERLPLSIKGLRKKPLPVKYRKKKPSGHLAVSGPQCERRASMVKYVKKKPWGHLVAPGQQVEDGPTVMPTELAPRCSKRSTERGEGRSKLIAGLTKHHKYADRSCLNQEPIGNNELARQVGVSKSTASEFFKVEFKGYGKYQAICRNSLSLAFSLKALNDEFKPSDVYDL